MQVIKFESSQIYNAVYAQIEQIGKGLKAGRVQYVVVPDRFSLSMEKMIMERLNLVASFDVQVVTFSRLANMVIGKLDTEVLGMLDATLIVEFLLKKNKDKFVCFNTMPVTSSFAKILFDSISQIKSCKITVSKLKNIVAKTKGNLNKKMQDICTIYELYEDFIKDKFTDSNNKLAILCERLCASQIFNNCDVHFSNFADFTSQDYDIIENTIKCCNLTTITILKSQNQSNKSVFFGSMDSDISAICEKLGAKVLSFWCENHFGEISTHINGELFSLCPNKMELSNANNLQLFLADNIFEEVNFVAKKILQLVSTGVLFKDICLNVSDLSLYQNEIEKVFSKYNIPFWLDKNFKLKDTEQARFLSSLFKVVKYGFLPDDVLNVVYNQLSGLDFEKKELFRKFSRKFGLVGTMWTERLKLKNEIEGFADFEEIKLEFMAKIIEFKNKIDNSKTVFDFCEAVEFVLNEFDVSNTLEELSISFEKDGDLRQASILRQTSDKISKILQEQKKIFADENLNFNEWVDIFEAGVEMTEISPLPMAMENVLVGQMLSTVFEEADFVFVLGATENCLPAFVQDVGIISDADILAMQELNLSPTIDELNKKATLTVLQNMCLARKCLTVSMPQNLNGKECQKSRVLVDLCKMFTFQNEPISAVSIQRFLENGFKNEKEKQCFTISALEDLLDYYAKSKMNLEEKTNEMLKKQFPHEFEVMQSGATQEKYIKSAEKLFFADGFTKATEVERFFMCPFLHFVEYGLKLKENETSKVRPVDIGNILHSIVEEFAKFQRGKNLDKKQISDFATLTFEKIISQKQFEHLLLGVSNKALAKGLCREAERICQAINFQNQNSKYKISFVEQSFGTNFAKMPEIAVYKSDRKLLLRGKIDRVDTFDTKFRIIDYKTGKGKSEFNMLDLYMGKKLQLYIYLYALKNSWENKIPIGAYYFPIHNEYQDKKPTMTFENYALNGVSISDFEILKSQDTQLGFEHPKSGIIGFSIGTSKEAKELGVLCPKADANLVSQTEMYDMINYSYKLFSKALAEILSGYIEAKPVKDACEYCLAKCFCPNFKDKTKFRSDDFEVNKQTFGEILKNE